MTTVTPTEEILEATKDFGNDHLLENVKLDIILGNFWEYRIRV